MKSHSNLKSISCLTDKWNNGGNEDLRLVCLVKMSLPWNLTVKCDQSPLHKVWKCLGKRKMEKLKNGLVNQVNKSTGVKHCGRCKIIIIRLTCQFHLKWVARLLCLFWVSFSTPFCLRDLPLIASSVWDHFWSYLSMSSSVFHVHAVQQLQILWCC